MGFLKRKRPLSLSIGELKDTDPEEAYSLRRTFSEMFNTRSSIEMAGKTLQSGGLK